MAIVHRITAYLKTKHLYLAIVRYILGLYMLPYALSKILRTQMVISPHIWENSHGILSGKALTWAFYGYSPWFQVLVGFFELIPALLLFFRRTTLLGAILLLPVSLNVLFVNYALDLWEATQRISLFLFILNCLIFIIEWKRVWLAIQPILLFAGRLRFAGVEWVINGIIIAMAVYYFSKPLLDYRSQTNELTGDWHNQHPVEWNLQLETLNDSTLKHREMKCYFGAFGMYSEISDSKLPKPSTYALDSKGHKLTWFSDYKPIVCDYKLLGDTGLLIEKNTYTLDTVKQSQYFSIEKNVDTINRIKLRQYFTKRVLNYGASQKNIEAN